MKGLQPAVWDEGETIWFSLTRGSIEAAMREMETLNDLAMIAWVKKKEKMKRKQARKSIVVDIDDESEGGGKDKSGNGRKCSKRDLGDVKVGDAVAIVRMEVEVEKLAMKEADAEARARRKLRKKQKKGLGLVSGKEPEVGQKVGGKGKANGKGKAKRI